MKQVKLFIQLLVTAFDIAWQWFYGSWRLTRIEKPIVSIFGGKRLKKNSKDGKQVHALAKQLVDAGHFLLTGGGPGAMEAAHCGALEGGKKGENGDSLGIGVHGVDPEFKTSCSRDMFFVEHFFIRKYLLINYSQVIIIFPGGYGTMDEFFEVINLMKVGKLSKIPVILVGTDYWGLIKQWVDEVAIEKGLIRKADAKLFVVVDNIKQVLAKMKVTAKK